MINMHLGMIDPLLIPCVQTYADVTVTGQFPNKCYAFARMATFDLVDTICYYVEGIVMVDDCLPIGHAWVKDRHNHCIDGTAIDQRFARLGIEIPAKVFIRHMRSPAFASEYEKHDLFPFVRAYKQVVRDADLISELHPNV